ncbi:nucleotidyltransferase domain-containing protein [Nibrella saemangeumensis]|uniref:nucleotidyltransferase domain-containing protein n=1 Tax=Nibrella saemangeumensis TaxID=1084526 RepID=UPI0031EA2E66
MHRHTAEVVYNFFAFVSVVDTFLVVNSCARGKATPESDLDFAVLANPDTPLTEISRLEQKWAAFSGENADIARYRNSHRFAAVHLDIIDGRYIPSAWDDGGGPDFFEVEIGNRIAYPAPLGEAGLYFQQLRTQWLPYYDEDLRLARLAMASAACEYDLDHIPFYVKRGLHYQAFDRLYKAFQEFLQALFIRHKTYPIAYNKWIKEQVVSMLNLPELYVQLPPILSVTAMESNELNEKANALRALLHAYCQ